MLVIKGPDNSMDTTTFPDTILACSLIETTQVDTDMIAPYSYLFFHAPNLDSTSMKLSTSFLLVSNEVTQRTSDLAGSTT